MFFNAKALVVSAMLTSAAVAAPVTGEVSLAKRQSVPLGTPIYGCRVPGTVALTFDDGVHTYTEEALDLLDAAGMKGTFFVNGNNFSPIENWGAVAKRMQRGRHQLASHTDSHIDLTSRNSHTAQAQREMTNLETKLLSLTGYRPTYMRPPYFATDAKINRIMGELGYRIIIADIDTKDYENRNSITVPMNNFRAGLDAGGSIVLAHDVWPETVRNLLPAMIAEIKRRGLRAVTVGECLGEGYSSWYKVSPR